MFSRKEVFTERFLPRELPGRAAELDALSGMLEPATRGEPAASCWVIGPSGAGKTSTVRHLLEQLRVDYDIPFARVECVGATRWELLRDVAAPHPQVAAHDGMGPDELQGLLEDAITEPFVVVLDEFDGLETPAVLADLATLDPVSLICIAHELEGASHTIPDTAEELRYCQTVRFEPYDVDAMLDILRARADTGLRPAVVDDQLERIADEVAGSARYGVQSLRSAVELGVERGHTEVREADVADAFDHANARVREQLLASLSRQHHVVYRVIREAGEEGVRPREILDRYRERSADPRSRQMVARYRRKLQRYDLVDCERDGSSRWDRWWAVDEQLSAPTEGKRAAGQ